MNEISSQRKLKNCGLNKIDILKEKNMKKILKGKLYNLINKAIIINERKNDSKTDSNKRIPKINLKKDKLPFFVVNKTPNLIKQEKIYQKWEDEYTFPEEFIIKNFTKEEIDIIKSNKSFFKVKTNNLMKRTLLNKNLIDILDDEENINKNSSSQNLLYNVKKKRNRISSTDFFKFREKKFSFFSESTNNSTREEIKPLKFDYINNNNNKSKRNLVFSLYINKNGLKDNCKINKTQSDNQIFKNKRDIRNYDELIKKYENKRLDSLSQKFEQLIRKRDLSEERFLKIKKENFIEKKNNEFIKNMQKTLIKNYTDKNIFYQNMNE